MKIEHSKYKDKYQTKLQYEFGNFYVFEKYVIGEVNEGVTFNWECANKIIEGVYAHFKTTDIKICYISNRIHSYSVVPQDWIKFYQERHHLEAVAIVGYNKQGFISYVLEKIFQKALLKKFTSLDDAVAWATKIKALKKEVTNKE